MKTKLLAMVMASIMLVVGFVSGTLAWLTSSTDEIKNTFTTSNIKVTLTESTGEEYPMVPGYTITKDPKVTVEKNSEKCFLFVKVEKSENFGTYMEYTMADGWTALPGNANVFYRVVDKSADDQIFAVIKDNTVTVKSTVEKSDMDAITTDAVRPTLTITAYACQYYSTNETPFDVADAWTNAQAGKTSSSTESK